MVKVRGTGRGSAAQSGGMAKRARVVLSMRGEGDSRRPRRWRKGARGPKSGGRRFRDTPREAEVAYQAMLLADLVCLPSVSPWIYFR